MKYTKEIPVLAHYDVIVCGGGAAGIGAALCLHNGKAAVQNVDVAKLVAQVKEAGSFV